MQRRSRSRAIVASRMHFRPLDVEPQTMARALYLPERV
jgi:hypothetical protein